LSKENWIFLKIANMYNLKENAFASVPEDVQWLFFAFRLSATLMLKALNILFPPAPPF
jgi:hypothetical protein